MVKPPKAKSSTKAKKRPQRNANLQADRQANLSRIEDAADADTSRRQQDEDESENICEICHIVQGGAWVVRCDGCQLWFHFNCVHFDSEEVGESELWFCTDCQEKALATVETEVEQINKELSSQTDQVVNPSGGDQVKFMSESVQRRNSAVRSRSVDQLHHSNPNIDLMVQRFIQRKTQQALAPQVNSTKDASERAHAQNKSHASNANGANQSLLSIDDNNRQYNPEVQVRHNVITTSAVIHPEPHHSTAGENVNEPLPGGGVQIVDDMSDRSVSHSNRSKSKKAQSSKGTSSSRGRLWLERQRLKDELELQTKLDEERIALKLEALKLKEEREKKFLEERFKVINDELDGEMSSDDESKSSKDSKNNQPPKHLHDTAITLKWIEDQRKRKSQLIQSARNMSIEMSQREINTIVDKQLEYEALQFAEGNRPGQLENKTSCGVKGNLIQCHGNEDPLWCQNQPNAMIRTDYCGLGRRYKMPTQSNGPNVNSTFIHDNHLPTSTHYDINMHPNPNNGRQLNTAVQGRLNPPGQSQQIASRIAQQQQNFTNQNLIPPSQNGLGYPLGQQNLGVRSSGRPIIQNSQQYTSNPSSQNVQFADYTQQPTVGQPGFQMSNQAMSSSQYFRLQRPPLTANQIAARHVVKKKLPEFYGNPGDWPDFIQKLISTTEACGFNNTENLDRLQDCLRDPARGIVRSQLTRPECVPSIIETLEQKYGRPEIVVKAVLKEIREEQPIKADRLEDLSNYGYKVQNVCHTIQSQQMEFYLHNPELIQDLVEKLPYQTKIDWAKFSDDLPHVSLATLSEWLIRLSRSLNRITMPEISTYSKNPKNERRTDNSPKSPNQSSSWLDRKAERSKSTYLNAHGAESSSNADQSRRIQRCQYCSNDCKSLAHCSKFKAISIDEKWTFVYKNKKVCRGCLYVHQRKCTETKECGVNGCSYKHHPLLHDNERMFRNKPANQSTAITDGQPNPSSSDRTKKSAQSNSSCNAHQGGQTVLYKIIPVRLTNGNVTVSTYAYMDDGSGLTLMENELAEQLGLKGTPQTLCLRWTSGTTRQENNSMKVALGISGEGQNQHNYQMKDVRTVTSLDLPKQSINKKAMVSKYPYLERIPFRDFEAAPRILIGLDNVKLGLSREHVEGRWSEPIASKTLLGWVVHGSNGPVSDEGQHMHHHVLSINKCPCENDKDDELHRQIADFFSLENFGIRANNPVESKESQRAAEIMKATTVRRNNRFETGLLWKFDDVKFPNNYSMALKRLECQEKRTQSNPALMANINNQIRNFVAKGYARKLTLEEINVDDPRIWYLPIFHYLDPKKPEKVRLVWDAAAKYKGTSLNSMLMVGPDNLVALVDILRRFREGRFAIGGDLEEMFHQVEVVERDRNSQRFLWRDGNIEATPDVYVMDVLTFGTSCSPSLAQNAKDENASDFEKEYARAVKAIKYNHYVDDWLDSQHTVEDTIQLAKEVRYVHKQGGFNLRKFVSNSKEVLQALGDETGETTKNLDASTMLTTQKVLGMWWDAQADCFTYSLKYTKLNEEVLLGLRPRTKRETLKTLMSVYDPLGFIAFFLVQLKIILQDIWKSRIAWDDQLPPELNEKWKQWIKFLPLVQHVKVPRLYSPKISPNTSESIELHTFVDASKNAYCAVCYLRVINPEGVDCALIGAKTKVAPIKPLITIPRLELLAAVLGSRLAKSIQNSLTLKIDKRYFWSDSRDVLCWIRSTTRKYRQFVTFRVSEILEETSETEWRWVPGKSNVADDGTKWAKNPNFDQNARWFRGPEFLYGGESSWPQDISQSETTEEEIHVHLVHSRPDPPSRIVPENFSSWSKMVNVEAWATRFMQNLIATVKGNSIVGPLKTEEMRNAECTLYRLAQFDRFNVEISTLQNSKEKFGPKAYVKKSSPIYKYSPYVGEDGLLRVRGRIDNIEGVKFETKRPIILPKDHKITELIVNNYHRIYLHRNNETVMNELKQRFVIPKLRVVLKKVISSCQTCKINRAKPVVPEMGDLPIARLSPGFRAFTYTGVDYFGPINVVVKRGTEKRWGVLFTCLTVRAIHVEIAASLSADSCILCVRNFTNLRGTPIEFYSDNGTNMTAADKELKNEFEKLDKNAIQSHYTRTYTSWTFNPPAAPHFGGAWERLIGSVKDNLRMVMFTRTPKEELLRSYLWEIVNIVNSRPLTYVPIDSAEDEALTPNHFIFGTSNGHKAPGDFPFEEISLTRSWRRSQELTNKFWRRWIKEYLPTLTCRTKWFPKADPVKIGDIVLLVDEKSARNEYPRGRVIDVLPDKYGQVRRATVRFAEVTPAGHGRTVDAPVKYSVLTRPIAKLAVLDVTGRIDEVKPGGASTSLNGEENVTDGNDVHDSLKARNPAPLERIETVTNDSRKPHSFRRSKRICEQKSKIENKFRSS